MPGRYNGWGLYRDAGDPRLIVPKRIPAMGWTINLGHRFGPISLLALCLIVAAIIIGAVFYR